MVIGLLLRFVIQASKFPGLIYDVNGGGTCAIGEVLND